MTRSWIRLAAIVIVVMGLAASACSKASDDTSSGGGGGGSDTTTAVDESLGEDLMWDDGPCDTAKPKVPLGIIVPYAAGPIALEDQATAAEVSAEAFNERGGINGQCIEMHACDDDANANKSAECARSMVSKKVAAQVNDSVVNGADVVLDTFTKAGIPRLDGAPAPVALSSPTTYTLGMGSLGYIVAMPPVLAEAGATKFAIIRADVAGAAALQTLLKSDAEAVGGEIVADIPVTVGTSDFSQFVLAAEKAGADGILMATGNDETIQVLRAAQQLGSDLTFAISLGSLGRADVADFGELADQMVFTGDLPPATADPEPFPLLAVANRELAASGEERLQPDKLTTSALRSWVYLYALISMLRDAKPAAITPESVTKVLNEATDVDLGGLEPPWTPNKASTGIFTRVSQPYYWKVSWDSQEENFVVGDDQVNALDLLAGKTS